jgi:integrase
VARRPADFDLTTLAIPERGNRVFFIDKATPGFGVRVTSAGACSFVLDYRTLEGRQRRITIGDAGRWDKGEWRPGSWTLKAAKDQAQEHRRKVDTGGDPMANRHEVRGAPTVDELADRFVKEHLVKRRPSTKRDYESLLKLYIRPALGRTKVSDVTHPDVEKLHREVATTAPYQANRVVAVLSKMCSLAVRWRMRPDNPVRGVERAVEHRRERYLTGAEIARLSEVLLTHPERVSANAVRLLLLTGARKGELLSAKWADFDLEEGIWVKPAATTKTARLHRIPLSAPAIELLVEMKAAVDREFEKEQRDYPQAERSPYVFPSLDGKPLTDIKKFWASACRDAGLGAWVEKRDAAGKVVKGADGTPIMAFEPNARVHDLRHTYASVLASAGLSLPIIGALLGHTQVATTSRYSHLMDDPLRAATERAAAVIGGAAQRST